MSSDVFSTFENDIESRHKEMIDELESIDIDNLKAEGVSLNFGGKVFKFTDLEIIENSDVEEKIRKEYREKLNTQQQRIRDKINAKINQIQQMHQSKLSELQRKEDQLRRKYSQASMMPDINETHLMKGLSVVKGGSNDELIWVYRAVYNPRFVIIWEGGSTFSSKGKKYKKALPENLVKRMKRNMIILVHTKGTKISDVKTKKLDINTRSNAVNLPKFPHYHQTSTGDCWGKYSWPDRWSDPDDILKVCRDSEAVLETINTGSLAEENPSGLPRIATVKDAVKNLRNIKPNTVERKAGSNKNDDVWQAV